MNRQTRSRAHLKSSKLHSKSMEKNSRSVCHILQMFITTLSLEYFGRWEGVKEL